MSETELNKLTLNEYMDNVKNLTGNKIKFVNPVIRASYEGKSIISNHWLTLKEYEGMI